MIYPDEVLDKKVNRYELASIFYCSISTILGWKKLGLECIEGRSSNRYQNRFTRKPDTYILRNVVEFLQKNNKKRYILCFEKHLYDLGYRQQNDTWILKTIIQGGNSP